jgi:LysM repeat protein
MESEISVLHRLATIILLSAACGISPASASAQERPAKPALEEPAQMQLRRGVKSREYQGKNVEGEERVVRPRDTLWRILIQERGLSGKRFSRYVILITTLNPNIKRPDVLQVGDTLFIPVQADEILGLKAAIESAATKPAAAKVPTEGGATNSYQVKAGDQLYQVLREQLGIKGKADLHKAVEQLKALNPAKKNWDTLLVGETIRLPGPAVAAAQAVALPKPTEKTARSVGLDYGQKITVQENLDLLASVMKVLGQDTTREGEEVVPLREGTVHIDRSSYPIIQGPKKGQRAVLDMQSKITPALRTKLEGEGAGLPVVSVKKGASLHDAVTGLLSKLGFQSLPSNQPVVIQDGGVAVQVKGEWMMMPPDESGAMPQVLVVSLTDAPGQTPDYLRDYLSLKGMNFKEILLPSATSLAPPTPPADAAKTAQLKIENWPADKIALVDAFLAEYGINFSGVGAFPVVLRDGIRMDAKVDRVFEYGGRRVVVSFKPFGEEVRTALQQGGSVHVVELDLSSMSSRELIARLLASVGESAAYREQRFQANERAAKDKLTLGVPGFYVAQKSLLLTDRQIPKELERFFAEKNLRVVRFQ